MIAYIVFTSEKRSFHQGLRFAAACRKGGSWESSVCEKKVPESYKI